MKKKIVLGGEQCYSKTMNYRMIIIPTESILSGFILGISISINLLIPPNKPVQ